MGLFDQLFGSSSSQKTNQTTTGSTNTTGQQAQTNQATSEQNTKQQQSQTSNTNTSSTSTQGQTTQSQTQQQQQQQQQQQSTGTVISSSLDQNTLDVLKNILPSLSSNANAAIGGGANSNVDALNKIATDFYAKAHGGNDTAVQAAVDAATSKAKLDFQTGEGAQINQIAQAIGSKGNTYSQLLAQKGQQDLATQIANIAATGQLQASQMNSQDLASSAGTVVQASGVAGQDVNTAINPLVAIISLIKGAQQTQETQGSVVGSSTGTSSGSTSGASNTTGTTNTASTEQTIADLIGQITGATQGASNTTQSGTLSTVQNTTGTTKDKSSKGIIGDILSIF
jgi:hypothetical protein